MAAGIDFYGAPSFPDACPPAMHKHGVNTFMILSNSRACNIKPLPAQPAVACLTALRALGLLLVPDRSCSALAGNALNWVPLIGLDTLLPFIDNILPIAQSVEDQYKAYFASGQDTAKQRQQITTLISSNDALLAQLKAQIKINEMDVISIQADLFTVNTNRNTAKDALQVSTMQSASLVLHTKYLLISSRVKYPHLSASFVFHVYTREGLALGMRILSHQQLLSILEIGRYARVCSYRPFTYTCAVHAHCCTTVPLHCLESDVIGALQRVGENFRAEIQKKLQLDEIGDIFSAIASVYTAAKDSLGSVTSLISKPRRWLYFVNLYSTWQNIAYCSSCMVCIYSSGSCKNCRFR